MPLLSTTEHYYWMHNNNKPNITGSKQKVESQANWKAKTALLCYITLIATLVAASILVAIIMVAFRLDIEQLNFPFALVSLPVTETGILIVTLLFARGEHATLKDLGLKKPNIKTLTIVSCASILLLIVGGAIALVQEFALGPNPDAELLT